MRDQGHDTQEDRRLMSLSHHEIQALLLNQNQLSCFHPPGDQNMSTIKPCYLLYNNML